MMLYHNPTHEQLVEFMYSALAQPIGLVCTSDDPERARQALYRARTKHGDETLDVLQFKLNTIADGNLVICKRKVEINS